MCVYINVSISVDQSRWKLTKIVKETYYVDITFNFSYLILYK